MVKGFHHRRLDLIFLTTLAAQIGKMTFIRALLIRTTNAIVMVGKKPSMHNALLATLGASLRIPSVQPIATPRDNESKATIRKPMHCRRNRQHLPLEIEL